MDTSIKVLIIDDSAMMRRILRNILKELEFKNLVEADDGKAALDILEEQKIDLIISDWNMPKMTGLELLIKVRASIPHKNTPFLMVTAEAQKQNIIEAVQAGVSSYVVKPFTAKGLLEKLNNIII